MLLVIILFSIFVNGWKNRFLDFILHKNFNNFCSNKISPLSLLLNLTKKKQQQIRLTENYYNSLYFCKNIRVSNKQLLKLNDIFCYFLTLS